MTSPSIVSATAESDSVSAVALREREEREREQRKDDLRKLQEKKLYHRKCFQSQLQLPSYSSRDNA
jgi:MoxR-like ATPase